MTISRHFGEQLPLIDIEIDGKKYIIHSEIESKQSKQNILYLFHLFSDIILSLTLF